MVAHLQVKLCARLGTNLLDLTTDVRSLVKDLLPKPIKKSAQDTSSETPPVPDPASNKSVVEGTVSIQHVLFEINGKTYQNLNQCKHFHLPFWCNFIRKLVIYYCKLSEWVYQFQFLLPKLSISDRFLWECTSPHILIQHVWGLCNVWCLPLTPLHQSYLYIRVTFMTSRCPADRYRDVMWQQIKGDNSQPGPGIRRLQQEPGQVVPLASVDPPQTRHEILQTRQNHESR